MHLQCHHARLSVAQVSRLVITVNFGLSIFLPIVRIRWPKQRVQYSSTSANRLWLTHCYRF
ncbi:hypothetical protein BS50DRAFT_397440 [Corynespora cassiicola Philippines]|uniref:Uncharacterized protein n=1 Tax=Corynespora cassiicola Philippines TaxID=1448308 RepID=A0A2T2NL32_CORCC|nr:hypothetical protein BS50DRAFT_397440 [Corynespora cassiicola Philippines]